MLRRPADTEARRRLRSASSTSLNVRRTRLSTVGDRAFPVTAARPWNSLPSHVTAAASLFIFCCRLKSHLSNSHFLMPKIYCTRFPVTFPKPENLPTCCQQVVVMEFGKRHVTTDRTEFCLRQLVTDLLQRNWCNGFLPLSRFLTLLSLCTVPEL